MHDNGDLFKEITTTPSVLSTTPPSISICASVSSQQMSLNNVHNCIQMNQNCILSANNNGLSAIVPSVINSSSYNGIQNMNYLQSQANMQYTNMQYTNTNDCNFNFQVVNE
eukprot:TRINITY_DN5108_c0_g1_i1.p1 TRINITY_DN5108_c0_g1~~TRINITY_DN5108_c0_g1_i1.p1  ORF type:complete len:123 (-),score=3.73 TRINITY_DN5108_c0_g1_i1:183-515(-)